MRREFMALTEDASWAGYGHAVPKAASIELQKKLDATDALLNNDQGMSSARLALALQEAMTTSDFPQLLGGVLERQLIYHYTRLPPVLTPIFMPVTIKDFREARLLRETCMVQRLGIVQEKGEYLAREFEEDHYSMQLDKYGNQVDFSWEAWINDDLGAFARWPQSLAESASNTIAWLMTSTFWGAGGPSAAFFNHATEGQMGVSNLPLTIGNLETAVEQMNGGTGATQGYLDCHGEPILNKPKYLVVGPALEFTARQILTSANKMWLSDADDVTPPAAYPTDNVIRSAISGLVLIVDPWIPVVDTTTGATTWAIFSENIKPGAFAQLRGKTGPEIWMKSPDAVKLGGGAVNPFEGDFATDNIFYRVRLCADAIQLEPRGGWASAGV